MVEYPEGFSCPNCNKFIQLDYSERNARTTDIQTFHLLISTAFSPGKAKRQDKQHLRRRSIQVTFCTQCYCILGTSDYHVDVS
ncbi:MAG: hypothetical protein ACFFCS_26745 [Candidatus Hodarchaeota archaeon]